MFNVKGDVIKRKYDQSMQMVISLLIITFILAVCAIGVIVIEAQSEPLQSCYVSEHWDVIEDVTGEFLDPVTGIYAQWYSGDPDLMAIAEARQADYMNGGNVAYGYFDTDLNKKALGYWVFPASTKYRVDDGTSRYNYLVWIGTNWTIGTDGALHSPCGVLIVDRVRMYNFEAINSLKSIQRLVQE